MSESNISVRATELVQSVTPSALQGDTWFGRNKTKLLGFLAILTSFILSDATLAADLDPLVYRWVIRIFGFLALYLGILNNPPEGK